MGGKTASLGFFCLSVFIWDSVLIEKSSLAGLFTGCLYRYVRNSGFSQLEGHRGVRRTMMA